MGNCCNSQQMLDLLDQIRACTCNPIVANKLQELIDVVITRASEATLQTVLTELQSILTELETKASETSLLNLITRVDNLTTVVAKESTLQEINAKLDSLADLADILANIILLVNGLVTLNATAADILVEVAAANVTLGDILLELADIALLINGLAKETTLQQVASSLVTIEGNQDTQIDQGIEMIDLTTQLLEIARRQIAFDDEIYIDTCNANTPVIRSKVYVPSSNMYTVVWVDLLGAPIATPVPSCYDPLLDAANIESITECLVATANGTGYNLNDQLNRVVLVNIVTNTIVGSVVYNSVTMGVVSVPSGSFLPCLNRSGLPIQSNVELQKDPATGDYYYKSLVFDSNTNLYTTSFLDKNGLLLSPSTVEKPAVVEELKVPRYEYVSQCFIATKTVAGQYTLGQYVYYLANFNEKATVQTAFQSYYLNASTNTVVASPDLTGLQACGGGLSYDYEQTKCLVATIASAGIAIGDEIQQLLVMPVGDPNGTPLIKYVNVTQGTTVTPILGNLTVCGNTAGSFDYEQTFCYRAITAGTGYSIGDEVIVINVYNTTSATITPIIRYFNTTTGLYVNTFVAINFVDCCNSSNYERIECLIATNASGSVSIGDKIEKMYQLYQNSITVRYINTTTNQWLPSITGITTRACAEAGYDFEQYGCYVAKQVSVGNYAVGDKLVKVYRYDSTAPLADPTVLWLNTNTNAIVTVNILNLGDCSVSGKNYVLQSSQIINVGGGSVSPGSFSSFTGANANTSKAIVQVQFGVIRYSIDGITPTLNVGQLAKESFNTFEIGLDKADIARFKVVALEDRAILYVTFYAES